MVERDGGVQRWEKGLFVGEGENVNIGTTNVDGGCDEGGFGQLCGVVQFEV